MAVTKADNQYLDIEERVNKIFSPERGSMQFCPVKDILGHFADKWSIFTILALGKREKLRFNELKEMVEGISKDADRNPPFTGRERPGGKEDVPGDPTQGGVLVNTAGQELTGEDIRAGHMVQRKYGRDSRSEKKV